MLISIAAARLAVFFWGFRGVAQGSGFLVSSQPTERRLPGGRIQCFPLALSKIDDRNLYFLFYSPLMDEWFLFVVLQTVMVCSIPSLKMLLCLPQVSKNHIIFLGTHAYCASLSSLTKYFICKMKNSLSKKAEFVTSGSAESPSQIVFFYHLRANLLHLESKSKRSVELALASKFIFFSLTLSSQLGKTSSSFSTALPHSGSWERRRGATALPT